MDKMATDTGTATGQTDGAFLAPVEHPRGVFLRMGYAYSRRQFGKVFSPLSIFCARMPAAFTRFYGKIGSLDKRLELDQDTVKLLRGQVASVNGCMYCVDANRYAALTKAAGDLGPLIDKLPGYASSELFSPARKAALSYASELAATKTVSREAFEALREHYSEREVCDIVWVIASEHLYNVNNIGLNIGSDGLCNA
jgi:AhpD family alkylhydroperoxidase